VATAPVAVLRASRLLTLGRAQDAERLLRGAIAEGHHDTQVFSLLSASLRAQRRWGEAVEAARAAVRLGIDDSRAHVELALGLRRLGQDAEAVVAAREAVRLDPHSISALVALAQAATEISLPEAEAAAATLQRVAPYSATAHDARASIEIARKRWAEAERWLRESLRLDPLVATTHANLAVVLDQQGRREEARREHQEAVRLDPQREIPRQNLHLALRIDQVRGPAGNAPYDAELVGSTLAPAALARSLINVILTAIRNGDLAEALAAAADARAVVARLSAADLEDRRSRVRLLAAIARAEHNFEPAREAAVAAELLPEARQILRPAELLVFLNNLGAAQLRAGEATAATTMSEVLAITRAGGNPNNIGMALLNLGAAHAAAGDDGAAEACYLECLELALANGHAARAVRVELNLGQMRLRQGDVPAAAARVAHALELVTGLDEPMLQAKVEITEGGIAVRQGQVEAGRRLLLRALQVQRRGGEQGEVDGFTFLAEAAARSGRPRLAALHLARAARRVRTPQTRASVERTRRLIDGLGARP
jgi:tetratricopeptide (TPR) repeat protein